MTLKTATIATLSLLAALTTATPARAEEVDQFYSLDRRLRDSMPIMNRQANAMIARAVADAKAKNRGCDSRSLYRSMHKYFSFKNDLNGGLYNHWLVKSDDVYRAEVRIKDSIFGDFDFLNAPFFRIAHPDSRELQVGKHRIGTDKVDHFFSRGLRFFSSQGFAMPNYLDLRKLLRNAIKLESGLWGQFATGVFSYGDLAANFHGLRFWSHVLSGSGDPMGKNLGPYVRCQGNEWSVTSKRFDWSKYLDDSFDETINCNMFSEKHLVEIVEKRLAEMSAARGKPLGCPVNSTRYRALNKRYRDLGLLEYMINPMGKHAVYKKTLASK